MKGMQRVAGFSLPFRVQRCCLHGNKVLIAWMFPSVKMQATLWKFIFENGHAEGAFPLNREEEQAYLQFLGNLLFGQ